MYPPPSHPLKQAGGEGKRINAKERVRRAVVRCNWHKVKASEVAWQMILEAQTK